MKGKQMEIKLGQTVEDASCGFRGIAIQRVEQLNGNIQIAIQPPCGEDKGAYPNAMFVDYHFVNVLDDGVSDRTTPVNEAKPIPLGSTARDKATGFSGVVIERIEYMNGCVSYGVIPKHDPSKLLNENTTASYIPLVRIELVNEGIAANVEKPPVDKLGLAPRRPSSTSHGSVNSTS
jgi:hypothetical protein